MFSCAGMVLNAEKRRHLAEMALRRKATPDPSDASASASADALTAAISAPSPSAPALLDHRKKGVVEATASEDEDTCSGLVFKMKRTTDPAVSVHSTSDSSAPSFRENPPSVSSPRDIVVHECEGESAYGGDLGMPPSSNRPFNPSKTGR